MTRLTIDTEYLAQTLEALLTIPSPTGYTDTVVRFVSAELERLSVPIELTRRGAIRAIRRGRETRGARALVSHLDTLGAQVKYLKENGRLALVPIGNWSARFAEGARITMFSQSGAYRGTILSLKSSGHTFNDEIDSAPIGWDHVELRVDALAFGRGDLDRLGIEVGDIVAIDPQPEFMDNDFIVSRHLDDKAGVAILFATLEALLREKAELPVDLFIIFSISEEVGIGGASVLTDDIASLITVDNGTSAPGQASAEFGVTIAMADQAGPFDFHLTNKLVKLCEDNDIRYQKDIFRYYRSDSAAALEAGYDVRTALVTFGVDASHGYERIHLHALRSISELLTAFAQSPVEIARDKAHFSSIAGFPSQPMEDADVFPAPGKPPL